MLKHPLLKSPNLKILDPNFVTKPLFYTSHFWRTRKCLHTSATLFQQQTATIHEVSSSRKHKSRHWKKFFVGLSLIVAGALIIPLYVISEKSAKPSRYLELASDAEHGLVMPTEKNEKILRPLFDKVYFGMYTDPKTDFGASYEEVEFPSREEPDCKLRGWYIPPKSSTSNTKERTAIICVHGAFTDRREMLHHAKYLTQNGYPCLLFDLRDHGTSDSKKHRGSALGIREYNDIQAAVDYLQKSRPHLNRFYLFGSSNGAASSLMASIVDSRINCVIAENPYSHRMNQVQTALGNVLQIGGKFGHEKLSNNSAVLGKLFQYYLEQNLHIPKWYIQTAAWVCIARAKGLNVFEIVDRIHELQIPLLFMHGEKDNMVDWSHSQILFEKAQQSQGKEIRLFPQGRHSMLYNTNPQEYETIVLQFLEKSLQATDQKSSVQQNE